MQQRGEEYYPAEEPAPPAAAPGPFEEAEEQLGVMQQQSPRFQQQAEQHLPSSPLPQAQEAFAGMQEGSEFAASQDSTQQAPTPMLTVQYIGLAQGELGVLTKRQVRQHPLLHTMSHAKHPLSEARHSRCPVASTTLYPLTGAHDHLPHPADAASPAHDCPRGGAPAAQLPKAPRRRLSPAAPWGRHHHGPSGPAPTSRVAATLCSHAAPGAPRPDPELGPAKGGGQRVCAGTRAAGLVCVQPAAQPVATPAQCAAAEVGRLFV